MLRLCDTMMIIHLDYFEWTTGEILGDKSYQNWKEETVTTQDTGKVDNDENDENPYFYRFLTTKFNFYKNPSMKTISQEHLLENFRRIWVGGECVTEIIYWEFRRRCPETHNVLKINIQPQVQH